MSTIWIQEPVKFRQTATAAGLNDQRYRLLTPTEASEVGARPEDGSRLFVSVTNSETFRPVGMVADDRDLKRWIGEWNRGRRVDFYLLPREEAVRWVNPALLAPPLE